MIRFLLRIAIALLGAAIGMIVAAVLLDKMTLDGVGFLIAVGIFVVISAVVEPLIEKIGDEQAAIVAASSSLITTFIALLLTDLISDGLTIEGVGTWVLATLIVWAGTAIATLILLKLFIKNVRTN